MRRVTIAVVTLALLSFSPAFGVPAKDAVRQQLDHRTLDAKFTGVALVDCLDYLRDVSGANMHVNWRALEAAGISKDTSVNVRLRGVSLRKVLDLVLSEAGEGNLLTYFVDEGVIEITTKEIADQKMYTKVYPVEDLVTEVPDFTDAPNFNLQSNTSTSGRGGGGGGGGGGLFSGGTGGSSGTTDSGKSRTQNGESLVKLITDTIQPDIWRDNGGTASISYFQGKLIVTAPRSVHEMIGGPID